MNAALRCLAPYALLPSAGKIVSWCRKFKGAAGGTPTHFLRFKVFTFESITTVFVQRIEIEGGKIVEQREGVATGQNQSSVEVAMLLAMSELSTKPGTFTAP